MGTDCFCCVRIQHRPWQPSRKFKRTQPLVLGFIVIHLFFLTQFDHRSNMVPMFQSSIVSTLGRLGIPLLSLQRRNWLPKGGMETICGTKSCNFSTFFWPRLPIFPCVFRMRFSGIGSVSAKGPAFGLPLGGGLTLRALFPMKFIQENSWGLVCFKKSKQIDFFWKSESNVEKQFYVFHIFP